jgi:hypothetical protein
MVPLTSNAGQTLRWFAGDVWGHFGDDHTNVHGHYSFRLAELRGRPPPVSRPQEPDDDQD